MSCLTTSYDDRLATHGFTLVELLVTMTILGILFSLLVSNLTGVIPKAMVRSSTEVLLADIREQQMKAMTGYETHLGGSSAYGVRFEEDRYILFTGEEYQEDHQENYTIFLQSGLRFNPIDLLDSVLIFARNTGEVEGYREEGTSVTLTNDMTGEQSSLSFNTLGVADIE